MNSRLRVNPRGVSADNSGRNWGPGGSNWGPGGRNWNGDGRWRHRDRHDFAIGSGFGAPYDGYDNPGYAFDGIYDEGYRSGYALMRDDGACARRYRSYDPASGTFLGRDGRRRQCR